MRDPTLLGEVLRDPTLLVEVLLDPILLGEVLRDPILWGEVLRDPILLGEALHGDPIFDLLSERKEVLYLITFFSEQKACGLLHS